MWIFRSFKTVVFSFFMVVFAIAVCVWLYLNIQTSMQVSAQKAQIQLSESLPTKIHVGNYLETHAKGALDTTLDVDRELTLPLNGKYLANLSFEVTTPIEVDLDYSTQIQIETLMPLETTTDLVYQNKLLPQLPLKLDIPIKLSVPFNIKRHYQVPIKIIFDGPVYLAFNEMIHLYVKHRLKPTLNINDPMTMRKIATFDATMYNTERQSLADLEMNIDLPIRNIHP
ncbi:MULTISPECIES: hypothetical protein [unclassified Acinetobacter]|uniref:hypothetical protein n=1 Tax=Acinetobacter TaxID=469 RepID=UPI0018AAE296|nr:MULTISPECIES: hypothetical protein [unclassified Acinetobacter]MBJ9953290.1 hypothetical protein [Acinetobacter baumannii]